MRRILVLLLVSFISSNTLSIAAEPALSAGKVVLLHGLARTASSMLSLEQQLNNAGYTVCNIDYPSRKYRIETLAKTFVLPAIKNCFTEPSGSVHFVTHSLGGIIVRQLAAEASDVNIGRVVMLSPPNQGSEVVDKLGNWGLFSWINGPAGRQLGTAQDALPNQLGPATFELGIITGNRSINWILSSLIPGPDDGKVSIDKAKLQGMQDFLLVEQAHPFIMSNKQVQQQVIHFLHHGQFQH